ncbi:ribosome maturation factor RimP [Gordonia sp. VNQ95]|uniref:ribosome maturation factor RimP n=1 Tax=Gordonia sp. VNQ95 TaxID=3156619 RepID=UPI0032B5692B
MAIEKQRVHDLVEHLVVEGGFDLEDVIISSAAGADEVRLVVDRDGGADLDVLGALTRDINEVLDAGPDISDTPYTLEVTSPGIGRPLTLPRHWRRAQGRKVRATLHDGRKVEGRIGASTDDEVTVVTNTRGRIGAEAIPLTAIERAVVEVDFSRPSVAELQRCGLDDTEIARRREPGPTEL